MRRSPETRRLNELLWNREPRYYELARSHAQEAAAAGREYGFLRDHLPGAGRVLEVGCGDGTNIEILAANGLEFTGCDVSALSIRMAAGRRGGHGPPWFLVADGEALPFAAETFDAVLAVSVMEHLASPERVLEQMISVLAPGGRLILLSPQYGAPLGASPCRTGSGAGRFLRRLVRSHFWRSRSRRLGWDRVHPPVLNGIDYEPDRDTVVEPELRSLVRFLRGRGMRVEAWTSGFEWYSWRDLPSSGPQRAVRACFERLGRAGVPPYSSFGPVIAVAGTREAAR